jgi:hypothetical protein
MQIYKPSNRHQSQERVELCDDFRNAFNNILKQPVNGIGWHTRVRERYKNGRIAIHLHFEFAEYVACVHLQAVLDTNSNHDILPPLACGGEAHGSGGLDSGGHQRRESVFVAVYDLVQQPERLIPTMVGLRRLDGLNDPCGNLAIRATIQPIGQSFQPVGQPFGGGVVEQGERCDLPVLPIFEVNGGDKVTGCDLPRNVVQGGTCVGNTIANDTLHGGGRVGLGPFEQRGLERLVCLLKDESVELSFFIAPGHQLKTAQVLICPDDFEPCAI